MTRVLILLGMFGVDGAVVLGLLLLTRATLRFALSLLGLLVAGGLLGQLALLGAGRAQMVIGMAAVLTCAVVAFGSFIRFGEAIDERGRLCRDARNFAEAGRLMTQSPRG